MFDSLHCAPNTVVSWNMVEAHKIGELSYLKTCHFIAILSIVLKHLRLSVSKDIFWYRATLCSWILRLLLLLLLLLLLMLLQGFTSAYSLATTCMAWSIFFNSYCASCCRKIVWKIACSKCKLFFHFFAYVLSSQVTERFSSNVAATLLCGLWAQRLRCYNNFSRRWWLRIYCTICLYISFPLLKFCYFFV